MAASLTNKIITSAQLRAEIGDPSADPTSVTYLADSVLDTLISRYNTIALSMVDEKRANLSAEEIESFRPQAVQVTQTAAVGTPTGVAQSSIASTYFPHVFKAVASDGTELHRDPEITVTAELSVSFTGDAAWTPYRFWNEGTVLFTLPTSETTVYIYVVPIAVIEERIENEVVIDINNQIIQAALRMVEARLNMASVFKNEAKTEGP